MRSRRLVWAIAFTAVVAGCRHVPPPSPPSGHYLYVSNFKSGEVSGYRIDEATGKLAALSQNGFLSGHTGAQRVVLNPDGLSGFLDTKRAFPPYGGVVPFRIGAQGGLQMWAEFVFRASEGTAQSLAIHPSGRFLYGGYRGTDVIEVFQLRGGGVAEAIQSLRTHAPADQLLVDQSGTTLYVIGIPQTGVSVFAIDQETGKLTAAPGKVIRPSAAFQDLQDLLNARAPAAARSAISSPPVPADTGPVTVVPMRAERGVTTEVRVHPGGQFLFLLGTAPFESYMSVFLRGTDGFEPVVGSPFVLRRDARAFTIDPTGRFLFVAHTGTNQLSAYAIDFAAGLHPVGGSPFGVASGPAVLEVDPSGRFLYVAYPKAGTISVLLIDRKTGALTPVADGTVQAGDQPQFMTATTFPPSQLEAASLPSPTDAALLPIETTLANENAAVSRERPDGEIRRQSAAPPAEKPTPPQPLYLSCSLPHPLLPNGGIQPPALASNLERIPLTIFLNGDRSIRPSLVKVRRADEPPTVDSIEVAATMLGVRPTPVPISVKVVNTASDAVTTHVSALLELPVTEEYATKSVDDYLTKLLANPAATTSKDAQALALVRQDRAAAAAAMRTIFFENREGTFDVTCTYRPANAPPLISKDRVTVTRRGKFFEQAAFARR